ncbi:MAG: glycosyltransferase family 4 protein [Solirubrobacterales bacterium]
MNRALQLLRRASDERPRRRRRPPAIAGESRASGPGTVYYLCPDHRAPSGGVRAIYKHVDILNGAGRPAAVLHHRDGFSCEWFEHSTRVLGAGSVRLGPRDVLVVPEIYGPHLERLPRGPKLVVFNQNAYLTFAHLRAGQPLSYGGFAAALTISEDSAECLRFAFPGLAVSVVGNAIDPEVFGPALDPPSRRIAMMPRKRPEEAQQILRLLGSRLDGWDVVAIESSSEQEVAEALRSSAIFLALGKQEGFGLPVAEAMACGCYVVGFPAFGGREMFDPDFSAPVEDGDVLSAARELAVAMAAYERRPEELRDAGARARERVIERYAPRRQRDELIAFFERL